MSFQSTAWVLDHSRASGADRMVLVVLANYGAKHPTDRDGRLAWEAWPSVERIAHEAGLAKPATARNILRRLEEGGHIETVPNGCPDERIPKRRRPNLYRILLDNPRECWEGCATCTPPGGRGNGGSPEPSGVTGTPLPVDGECHGEGANQLLDQVDHQPDEQEGPGDTSPTTALVPPPDPAVIKERNRAALDKLPKAVDPEDVKALCIHLRERMYRHHGGPGKATVTPNWVSEMGRLLNSGPKDVDGYVPTATEVHSMIDSIFDHLNEPQGNGTFCWATVIQSPGNLRKKWMAVSGALRVQGPRVAQSDVLAAMDKLDRMGVRR